MYAHNQKKKILQLPGVLAAAVLNGIQLSQLHKKTEILHFVASGSALSPIISEGVRISKEAWDYSGHYALRGSRSLSRPRQHPCGLITGSISECLLSHSSSA